MTSIFEKGVERFYPLDLLDHWVQAEENLGLKNSMFIINKGKITQYYNVEEGERFYLWVVDSLQTETWFDCICEKFFKAIKEENKTKIFETLAIFNEIDEHDLGNDDVKRRLLRVRESTHDIIYKLGENSK